MAWWERIRHDLSSGLDGLRRGAEAVGRAAIEESERVRFTHRLRKADRLLKTHYRELGEIAYRAVAERGALDPSDPRIDFLCAEIRKVAAEREKIAAEIAESSGRAGDRA